MSEANPSEPIIVGRDLVRRFRAGSAEVLALRGVDLDVYPSELLAIQGRSGSGKTTLLNLLGALDRPTSGTVLFEGRDLVSMSDGELTGLRRHKIGSVFQAYGLLPLLSAYENVELPLRVNGTSRRERRTRTQEALEQVGLGARARHRPYELSGGEQQRVAIARALVARPLVILADEPTGDLDSTTGLAIGALLRDAVREQKVAVVVATHDNALANMADRVISLMDGSISEESRGEPQR